MATEVVASLLERSDPSKLFCEIADPQERGEAQTMVSYLMDCRQKQKLMCQQLCMLDNMMEFLGELKSPLDFLNDQCPKTSESGARKRWKALKKEYQDGLVEVGALISNLQKQSEQLQERRDRLKTLALMLEQRKEECQTVERIKTKKNQTVKKQVVLQLDESLQSAQHALRSCDKQLGLLKMENDALQSRLDKCTELRDQLWSCLESTQGLTQYRVMCVSPSEMIVELRPACEKLEPLKLSITLTPRRHFLLQVSQGTAGLLEETVKGPVEQLNAAMLEVMQHYVSQGAMLSEIQALHSRFAIDWRPGQRLLVFLKTASVVCHLAVGEGYPSGGSATLLAVRKEAREHDIASLQPPSQNPSLTEWLEYLSSCPDV
ncbi:uncharacterized protein si:dkey-225f5.4 [Clupea harengus]|uniref:Uncharacterized protein si:dkey-225f5.4 n=1 Tax=Clupea harengus TaxID=7950 RepID=A0A6P3WFH9_CLUHA|nr:uncharacterized protein si:dkey-225f5.4 [Clupea harengus]